MEPQDVEDILKDSLTLLGEQNPDFPDDGQLTYGPITVSVAPKEGKANTLLADHIFSPSLLIAERIERGLLPVSGRTMIELGAGAALPTLVAAAQPAPPALAVATDHPDPGILGTLTRNVARNGGAVRCAPFEWGTDPARLLALAPRGYDIVVLSDLLHFDRAHGELLDAIGALLARREGARVVVAAGVYTRAEFCRSFLRSAEERGIVWVERGSGEDGREEDAVWRGAMEVRALDRDQLGVRKGMCRWWVGQWAKTGGAEG
ncbi:hypothetical protein BV25DRAFT_1912251 [Artomyces pyxidatus]|uniref:Uncharacterized protein n=1 Tax=Artomyces pyxidatus TaxID=48021 RepID=A0ACB8TEN3_9AGAM|nr:hypothetical protein BV25DRAFT_1912251 [Artomyces pyxidatus]